MSVPEVSLKIRPGIELGSISDVGCHRENNEDRYQYWESADDEELERKGRLAIVADWMGGYEGGQEASRIAVETIERVYVEGKLDPQSLLVMGIHGAHQRILEYAIQDPGMQGMGTTCTAVALVGSRLFYAHIGDSRLYLIRGKTVSRVTRDHSYVSRLVETGLISSEEAENHPHRNILTAALGAGSEIAPEWPANPVTIESGDTILLCTDGLWGVVAEKDLQTAVAGNDPQESCRRLVQIAKEHGGPDNITAMIIRVE